MSPLKLNFYFVQLVFLKDNEPDIKIRSEGRHISEISLHLELRNQSLLVELKEEPEVSDVVLKSLEVRLIKGPYFSLNHAAII